LNKEDKQSNDKRIIKKIIDLGSEITGAATGAGLMGVLFGPEASIAGAATGTAIVYTIKNSISEFAGRLLGQREQARIGAVCRYIYAKIEENKNKGMKIREDDFFEKPPNVRSTAEEIFEGILLAAKGEYEEKKLKFLGNLFANLAFVSDIDRSQANLLIRIAQRCSYRQLCILSLFREKNPMLRKEKYENEPGKMITGAKRIAILTEILDLCLQGLVAKEPDMVNYMGNITPAEMACQTYGSALNELMELWDIEQSDIDEIARYLK